MHIDVRDILAKEEGSQQGFAISGETPELENLKLAAPLSGHLRLIVTQTGLLVTGSLETEVELECDRCLRSFNHHLVVPLEVVFSDQPDEDQFPIDARGVIDLTEPVRQEIEVHLPLQRLCQDDCAGLELKQKKDSNGSS